MDNRNCSAKRACWNEEEDGDILTRVDADAPTNDGDDDDVSREETNRQTPLLVWKAFMLAIHDAIIIADSHLVLEGCAADDVAVMMINVGVGQCNVNKCDDLQGKEGTW